ncbi:MAG: DUF935 family protein [Candidatus Peribacteraceae bacterium]|nr:DUF935 family protein [Candidatus Peribacteraceae bacterium]
MVVIKGKKGKKSKSTKPGIGASGTTNFQGMIDTGEYVAKLKGAELYTTVDKMRWSDASIQAALLMCELPIRSAEWDIEPGKDDTQGEEIADFIKDCLFDGLLMNWDDTVRNILLMHPFGVMVFEVVYKIREDGKITWRKWAPRLPKTIEKWKTDKNGELEEIMQRAYKDNNLQEFTIPIEKLMIFTHRQEGDNYLGTSILRQAYKHWFFRDKYYKIDAVATERTGIGIPVITLPDAFSDDDYDDAEKMAENIRGHEKAYVIKKIGWEFEFADLQSGSLKDPKEMLEHHTREILKSVLAQFVDLGGKGVGSYALAKEQSSMFLQALDASAKKVEEVVNKEIVKLVDYNYNVAPDEYPKLTHSDLGTKDVKELADALQALLFGGAIQPDEKLENYLRTVLKLPEREEGEGGGKKEKKVKPKKPDPDKPDDDSKYSEKHHRALTKAEGRVRFDEIRDFMDLKEREIIGRMLSILNREKARLIPLFESAIRSKDYADLQRLTMSLKSQYAAVFKEEIKKLFEYGKLKSSYEIKKPAPISTGEINNKITNRAFFLANRHEKQLLENLKGIAAVGMMDADISVSEAVGNVKAEFEKFNNKNVPATAALVTSEEINNGRLYTFMAFKNDIYGYQWSAILDAGTCNYCRTLDGKVIGTEDKAFKEFRPGAVHFNCRCIWVAIMKEEKSPPPFTGFPEGLRPQSVVPAWEFKDLEYPLPGAGGRKMPYGTGVH